MMRGDRRVRSIHFAAIIPRVIYIFKCLNVAAASEYGVPIEIKLWDTGRTPLSHMVDVTNEFGLKVLAEHNFLNDNNIAFSPYGLMGIMVALYEGVDGASSYQIQRAMQLPWKRNVMRIGFRDIHRTLKTYFVPEEGFLAGLALNNENVTFNDQYKKILRFYGFDLENDQLPTLSPDSNNTANATSPGTTVSPLNPGDATTAAMTTENKITREDATTLSTKEETTPTTNPNVETISTIAMDMTGGITSTTASPSLAPNAEDKSVSSAITAIEQTTTQVPSSPETEPTVTTVVSSATPITTTAATETTMTAAPMTTTFAPTTTTFAPTITMFDPTNTDSPTITTVASSTTTIATTQTDAESFSQSSQVTSALTGEPTVNNELDTSTFEMNTVEPSTQEMNSETASSTVVDSSTVTSTTVIESTAGTQQTGQMSTMEDMTTVSNSVTSLVNESTLETLERRKKSIVDFIITNPPHVDDYLYYRSFDIDSEIPIPNPDTMFMANGLRSVQVTYMHYDTVLEHAYLPHLEASALRLPLDSDRYYLLVILPTRGGATELGRLLARMARESDLSDVYSMLRPRRVRGIVPSFIVKGHVTLTTDLQKLGIRAVFEPRQRDFTPMTQLPGVYVRSIEQAVSVAIRKYRPDDHKKNRYVTSREPVVFSAKYPFLYFVMDANIHVALMAGKMVDPLNSRIL